MENKIGRDEILDAYAILIQHGQHQLRPMLDSVYEAGFAEGVKMARREAARSGSWEADAES